MKCVAHRLSLEWECRSPEECNDDGNGNDDSVGSNSGSSIQPGPDDSLEAFGVEDGATEDEPERHTYKDDSALKDQQSTGRKRAARWFPLNETALCEWSMKTNCGGGKFPITGCAAGLQMARHHGPDKNTLNNEKGNVHRICHTCHNRWHTLNDEGYDWTALHDPHSPKPAELSDIVESEEFWKGRAVVTAKD